MKTISISLEDKDYSLLSQIAKEDNRRLTDLIYLCLGRGLDFLFCETPISVKKEQDEYTEEEREQQAKNKELEKAEGWEKLSYDEMKEKGFSYVCAYLSNHERNKEGKYCDPLIDPLAERLKEYALKD